jgi:hypothetical protein
VPAGGNVECDLGDVVFATPRPISGRVVDAEGRPVGGCALALRSNEMDSRDTGWAQADGEGRFTFAGAGVGRHEVVVEAAQGFGRAAGLRPGDEGVRVVLAPMPRLVVRMVDASTSQPAKTPLAVCVAHRVGTDAQEQHHTRIHEDSGVGPMSVPLPAPGRYEVQVRAIHYQPSDTTIDVPAEGTVTLDVSMRPADE